MKLLGFERSIADAVSQLDLRLPPEASILDAGCGTGVIGLALMRHSARSTLVATDMSPELLQHAKRNAAAQGIDERRVRLGVSDISRPGVVAPVEGSGTLPIEAFDVVATGAVIGYARDQEDALHALLDLVKTDGCFLAGRLTSRRYRYSSMPLSRMERVIERKGFDVTRMPVKTFPARLTRTCLVARRG